MGSFGVLIGKTSPKTTQKKDNYYPEIPQKKDCYNKDPKKLIGEATEYDKDVVLKEKR